MRVAIMQPYLFPYWPYVQLMGCVDVFIILDTVQYIRRGWANRNRICLNGVSHLISFPIMRAPRETPFSEIRFSDVLPRVLSAIRISIAHAYAHRPYARAPLDLFEATFAGTERLKAPLFVATVLESFAWLRRAVHLTCAIELASRLPTRLSPHAEGYLIELARHVGADVYVNPIGGRALYKPSAFEASGIDLVFLESRLEEYDQGMRSFIPGLSVLDLVGNLSQQSLCRRLQDFEFVRR